MKKVFYIKNNLSGEYKKILFNSFEEAERYRCKSRGIIPDISSLEILDFEISDKCYADNYLYTPFLLIEEDNDSASILRIGCYFDIIEKIVSILNVVNSDISCFMLDIEQHSNGKFILMTDNYFRSNYKIIDGKLYKNYAYSETISHVT